MAASFLCAVGVYVNILTVNVNVIYSKMEVVK